MSFNHLSDNDDDLFSETSSIPPSIKLPNTSTTASSLDDFRSIIESADIDEEKIGSMLMRSKLALTLYESANTFIFQTNAYARTTFNTLNSLTDGNFQYNLYCDILEESIFRRMLIIDFVNAITEQTDEDIFKKISEIFKIEMDERFVSTYFHSMRKILNFVIIDSIELYKKVCSLCNREPSSALIEQHTGSARDYLSSDTYINSIFANIRKSNGHGYKS
jgi:hypothetical protein